MLRIVIQGKYYKESKRYSTWNARNKKECVYFYDYDEYAWYIIQNMEFSELQRFRLNLYNKYHKLIKFTPFWEVDLNWEKFEGLRLESPIIDVDNTDFAELLPSQSLRKRYFVWDSVRERYFLKSNFINFVNVKCPLM